MCMSLFLDISFPNINSKASKSIYENTSISIDSRCLHIMCRLKSITQINLHISSECKKENANCNINGEKLILFLILSKMKQ